MSEQLDKLKATVKELEDELQSVDAVDADTRVVLNTVLEEIRGVLGKESPTDFEPQSMMDRLNRSAEEFEGAHPTMASIIQRLIDGLGQMGI